MNAGVACLLRRLHEDYPCDGKRHHVTLNDDGTGLCLGVWVEGERKAFALDEAETENVERVVAEIDALLRQ